jgi:hypothetical protein
VAAACLALAGIPALAVAYFAEAGLPDALQTIPLETFGRALDWLAAQPMVDAGAIGVLGASKGAEAALQFASHWPRIRAVAVGAPTHVGWQGINRRTWAKASSWTLSGEELPYVAYRGVPIPFAPLRNYYARSLAAAPDPESAAIPVERIGGPILLVSGGRDQMWDSSAMSKALLRRLETSSFAHPVEHLDYPEAGHLSFGPPIPGDHPARRFLGRFGGTVKTNSGALEDGWPRVIAFLRQALAR